MTTELYTLNDDGAYLFHHPVDTDTIVSIANKIVAEKFYRSEKIESAKDALEFLKLRLSGFENEVFFCVFLDTKHRVIEAKVMFEGTINSASVHPRVLVKYALSLNASAVIISHNHPSGDSEPSLSDITITKKVKQALALVDIRVLDHIIVAGMDSVSLTERGDM